MRLAAAAVTLAVAASTFATAQQQPSVEELRAAGGKYLSEYFPKVSGTLLDERYTLIDASSGSMGVPNRISSDLMLVYVNGIAMSMRDAYSVNGAKIRDQKPRLLELLTNITTASWAQAQQLAQPSQQYFISEIVLHMNDPLSVLNFMTPREPERFTYSLEGRKKMDGAEVVGLRFQEKTGENIKYVLGTRYNSSAAGRFWLEPATGVIHQTEFYAESKLETGRTVVTYALSKDLNIWLPSKSVETYQERAETSGITGMGAGGPATSRRLEANVSYSNPRRQ
jgi:hypothetical protein